MDSKGTVTTIRRKSAEPASHAPVRAQAPFSLVIFGASGDLAKRKLIPALYHLETSGYMPESYAIVGMSRTPMSDEQYRQKMVEALREELGKDAPPDLAQHRLIKALHYSPGDNDDPAAFKRLKQKLGELEAERHLPGNRLHYLSVSPNFFSVIVKQLGEAGLATRRRDTPWTRVIIEKPFGHDLESARRLHHELSGVLDESQIYRIDHYLGKETVQNILSFRFGNSIFEPLFNRKYVDHVQITAAETIGMEGKRGAYFDGAGSTRDMLQNHLLSLLTLVAMEPPPRLEANSIHDAKIMLLRALKPFTAETAAAESVRGQYGSGRQGGQEVKGYRQEENVPPDSRTETFVALKARIDNWRWAGVPFYLRTGKRLAARLSELVVTFREPPLQLFETSPESDYCLVAGQPKPNQLVLRIQPEEGISLSVACKQPGLQMMLDDVEMDFQYKQAFKTRLPEAYERLLLDALKGDASLFARADEVDQAWVFVDSLESAWAKLPAPEFPNYAPGSDGPAAASKLFPGNCACWRPLKNDAGS